MSKGFIAFVVDGFALIAWAWREYVIRRRESQWLRPKCGELLPEEGSVRVTVGEGGSRPRIYMRCVDSAQKWQNKNQIKTAIIFVSLLLVVFMVTLLLQKYLLV